MRTEKQAIRDELLALRCRRKRPGAFAELVGVWERPLFYVVRRLVDNEEDAWDVLQQTWMKVVNGIAGLREPRSLPTWLYTVARNTAMNHLRRAYSNVEAVPDDGEADRQDVADETLRFDDADRVHWGLGRLAPIQREVLTLFFLDDLSIDEMAKVMGTPAGTAKSRLHYAKRALRAVLEKGDSDNE